MLTDSQKTSALKAVLDAVVESIKEAGPLGVPGGSLYAVLMTRGCTLEQFETMMGVLVRLGKVRKSGQLYFAA